MNEWISVEERLPDKDGEYLVNVHQEDEERGLVGDMVIPAWYEKCPLLFVPRDIGWHLLVVQELDETERGENGFGSSGR